MRIIAPLLLLLLPQVVQLQVAVSWIHPNNMVANVVVLLSGNVQDTSYSLPTLSNGTMPTVTYYPYTVYWWTTTPGTLKLIVSMPSMYINSAGGQVVVDVSTNTPTSTTYQHLLGLRSTSSLIISCSFLTLAIDTSTLPLISLGSATLFSLGPVAMGSGSRNYTITGNPIGGTMTLTNTIVAIPFITGFSMDKQSPSYAYSLLLSMTISSPTTYSLVISAQSYCRISFLRYSWLIFDQTTLQLNQTYFVDTGQSIGSFGTQTTAPYVPAAKLQCFFIGLTKMQSLTSTDLRFAQALTGTFSLSSPYSYQLLQFEYVNIRQRSCPAANPYYRRFDDMCYVTCPAYTMATVAYLTCSECHYSCLTCNAATISTVCATCAATDHRTISAATCPCDPNYYDTGVSLCVACDPTCLTCSGTLSTNCLTCNTTKLLAISGSSCFCPSTHTFYLATCALCSSLQVGCAACTGTTCTTCDASLFRVSNGLGGCKCTVGYALSAANLCRPCSFFIPGCLLCTNNLTCTSCDAAASFLPTLPTCTCIAGLALVNSQCIDRCGDGMILVLACDDGNTLSDDGCSQACQPQSNYTCHTLSALIPSVCSYNQPLSLTLSSIKKDPYSNSLTLIVDISPALSLLNQVTFLQLLSSNLPQLSLTSANYVNGQLTIAASYNSSLQGSMLTLGFTPPTSLINSFAMQPSSLSLLVSPTNGQALFYSASTFLESKALAVILKVCAALSLALAIVGQVYRGLIGVELMSFLQLIYFSVSVSELVTPPAAAISELSGYVNGIVYHSGAASTARPNIEAMNVAGSFLGNCNIMVLMQGIILLIGVVLWFVNGKINRIDPETVLKRLSVFILNEVNMLLTLFNIPNLAFSTGVYVRTEAASTVSLSDAISNWICILAGLAMAAATLYSVFSRQSFTDSAELLKDDLAAAYKLSPYHPALMCIQRFAMGLGMGLLYDLPLRGLCPLLLQTAYLAYCAAKRPYRRILISATHLTKQAAALVLFVLSFASTFASNQKIPLAFGWVVAMLAIAAVCLSYGCYGSEVYFKYCAPSNAKKTFPESNLSSTEVDMFVPEPKLQIPPEKFQPPTITVTPTVPVPQQPKLSKIRSRKTSKVSQQRNTDDDQQDNSVGNDEISEIDLKSNPNIVYL